MIHNKKYEVPIQHPFPLTNGIHLEIFLRFSKDILANVLYCLIKHVLIERLHAQGRRTDMSSGTANQSHFGGV